MTVTIEGLEQIGQTLNQIAPVEAKRLMRLTARDVAQAFADEAKGNVPVRTGKLAKSIKAKIDKDDGNMISASVRGAFYGHILDIGAGPDHIEHGFYMRAKEKIQSDLAAMVIDKFARRLVARLMKG